MEHGGRRPGAGRKAGSKNQRTKLLEEGNRMAAAGGIQPLEYMLATMRDEDQPTAIRMDAAKAAALYCHARLSTQHVTTDTVEGKSHVDWMREIWEAEEAEKEAEAEAEEFGP